MASIAVDIYVMNVAYAIILAVVCATLILLSPVILVYLGLLYMGDVQSFVGGVERDEPFVLSQVTSDDGRVFNLIDESHLPGGSKQRVMFHLFKQPGWSDYDEYIYAGPHIGYAQVALAYVCRKLGRKATVFIDISKDQHAPLTTLAKRLGANIVYYPRHRRGKRLKYIQEQSAKYVAGNPRRKLIPFGLNTPGVQDAYTHVLSPLRDAIKVTPKRIWVAGGSGLIFTTLGKLFPNTEIHVVQVGKKIWPDQMSVLPTGSRLYVSPYKFNESYPDDIPYNTPDNYDGKVWPFVLKYGQSGDWIWNTAGSPQ